MYFFTAAYAPATRIGTTHGDVVCDTGGRSARRVLAQPTAGRAGPVERVDSGQLLHEKGE